MQTIDVRDLPEPVARSIAAMVQTLRQQAARGENGQKKQSPIRLPSWAGTAVGTLSRAEIYDDAG
jgi:hypothetical protein